MSSSLTADPYQSRTDQQWEIAARQDPVLWSSADHPLSADQASRFEHEGFLHFPQLLTEQEAAALLAEAQSLADQARPGTPGIVVEPQSRVVRSVFRVHRTSTIFRRLAHDARLVAMARQILGDDVYVHQSRINFKPAFDGKEFFWHSDFETWHIEDGMPRMRAVSLSISLTDNNEFNGPLMVVPGSHQQYVRCVGATPEAHYEQSLKKQEYGVPSREAMQQLVQQGGITAPKGPPGSALLFDCNLMHGSAGNLSPSPRTNLFLVYNSVSNQLVEPYGGLPPRPEYLGERDVEPLPA